MSDNILRFEQLPNELIMDLFKYFHAGELFHTFYNLNHCFNQLIKSINYLSLIITRENYDQIDRFQIFLAYLYTLIINDRVDINLALFRNVRCLILNTATGILVKQLNYSTFPNLKHLSGSCIGQLPDTIDLYKIIFSDGFPNLKSCRSLKFLPVWTDEGWNRSPNIRSLRIGYTNVLIFQSILSACPNLHQLDIGIISENRSLSKIESHLNLKHLILRTLDTNWPTNANQTILKDLFTCIPNLEKLSIHQISSMTNMNKSFIKYDWLSSILRSYFLSLQRLYCYVHLFEILHTQTEYHLDLIHDEIMKNFPDILKNYYQVKLIIDRKEGPYSICLDDLY